tara:strand:- start:197 stop:1057 length:861 start_codon:yes stop_codon:yes gene_type:complete
MRVGIFIVGAPKSATTSLHNYLNQHPEILMSSLKEPDFFSFQEISEQALYYGKSKINNISQYHNLFNGKKGAKIFGESSVSYLFYPEVSKRIKEYNSQAKIIVMLRNPSDRAFSHYLMDLRLGLVSSRFEDIFYDKEGLHFQQYFLLGNYYSQVKRYVDEFKKDNVHIIWYSDFKKDAAKEIKKVFKFVDVDSDYKVNVNAMYNKSFIPRNNIIKIIYSLVFFRKLMLFFLSPRIVRFIKSILFIKQNKPSITRETREVLTEYYQDDIANLEKLLSINLSQWKKLD